MTVLLVDDDERGLFALKSYLEAHEISVITALNGKEALDILEEQLPNVILMDIMMPEMDGYEAIGIIRKNNKTKTIPIIAVTAKAMKGDEEKCLAAGADDYISKPVDLNKLKLKINNLTERRD